MFNNWNEISARQLKYLNILLSNAFGEGFRKQYLKHFYNVNSSKDLTRLQASEIIEKFVPDNQDCKKNIGKAIEKLNELSGQRKLF